MSSETIFFLDFVSNVKKDLQDFFHIKKKSTFILHPYKNADDFRMNFLVSGVNTTLSQKCVRG